MTVQAATRMFEDAAFLRTLGLELVSVEEGRAETRLASRPELLQQHGFLHAGVQATAADHTAGAAATSLLDAGEQLITVEFKINFLRPASGTGLRCAAQVLRRGKTLVIAESSVFAVDAKGERLTAKALLTFAVTSAR